MSLQQGSIKLLCAGASYVDTSAWNGLAKHPERDELVHIIQQRKQVVVASVISVAEVLRIKDLKQRRLICSTMRLLHGESSLFERPLDLAGAAARAFFNGEKDY